MKLALFFLILASAFFAYAADDCPSGADIFKERRVESILNLKEYLDYKVVYSSILRDSLSEIQKPGSQIEIQRSVSKVSQSSQKRYSHKICCYDMYANHSHQPFAELCLGK